MFSLGALQGFIKKFINKYQLLLNVLVLLLQTCAWFIGGYVFNNWLQNAKNELDKNADTHRHQLRVDYLKTELKTKQLSSIYTSLFAKFKDAEKEVGYLFGILFAQQVNPESGDWKKQAEKSSQAKEDLKDYLMKNLLFLSVEVKKCALDLTERIDAFWLSCLSCNINNDIKLKNEDFNDPEQLKQKLKKYLSEQDEIKQAALKLEKQMQLELGGKEA